MLIISHRGVAGPGCIENTLSAFQRAVDSGVDGIETDVRTTRDGKLVLFHDRIARNGAPVGMLDHAALQAAEGHAIPELGEALSAWPDLFWNLELKTPIGLPALVRELRSRGDVNVLISSAFHDLIHERVTNLGISRGLVVKHRPLTVDALLRDWQGAGPEYCIWDLEFADRGGVESVRDRGIANLLYNVANEDDLALARDWGVRGVILDRPELALRSPGAA